MNRFCNLTTLCCELQTIQDRWILLLASISQENSIKCHDACFEWDKLKRRDRIHLYVCSMIKRPNDAEHDENFPPNIKPNTMQSFFTCALHFMLLFPILRSPALSLLVAHFPGFHKMDQFPHICVAFVNE